MHGEPSLRKLTEVLRGAAADGASAARRFGQLPGQLLDQLAAALAAHAPEGASADEVSAETFVDLGEALLEGFRAAEPELRGSFRERLHDLLEHGNRRTFVGALAAEASGELSRRWLDLVVAVIRETPYTVRDLLERRARRFGDEVLFRVLDATGDREMTYTEVWAEVRRVAAALRQLREREGIEGPIAILSRNRLEMALIDLACLTSGIVNVMIPTTSSPSHVRTILAHSGAGLLIASSPREARKAFPLGSLSSHLRYFVLMERTVEMRGPEVLYLPDLLEQVPPVEGDRAPEGDAEAGQLVRDRGATEVATIMYTSGTTGQPKGIPFNQLNIVSKRFARAVALPEVGPGDRFLCYLPLCHTFGRWFEMTGSIFWGASYSFLRSPARQVMLDGFQRVRPTGFISVPSKWIELYEAAIRRADPEQAPHEDVVAAVAHVTGGSLRWGLSAAGRLEPEIFAFFQSHGVELLSGYGMTEATGGISMTRPGEYTPDSVGVPLPAIETRLAPDGELLLRGPYVIESYYRPLPEDDAVIDGWLHTGDLFDGSAEEGFRFRDRKKDVYKNSKGETVAPRLIERYFEDFDEVAACFVVGDGRRYNTALIYPNYDLEDVPLADWSPQERSEYFQSIVVSVNRFLDAYERVVDFALIDRDFDKEHGERTEKGSLRRRPIAENFAETIEELYRLSHVTVPLQGVDVLVPIWLLRELGLPTEALAVGADGVEVRGGDRVLPVEVDEDTPGRIRVGSLWYSIPDERVDLDVFLRTPRLWVGNLDLVAFSGEGIFDWSLRPVAAADRIQPDGWAPPHTVMANLADRLEDTVSRGELSHRSVHVAFSAILMSDPDLEQFAVRYLGTVLREGHSEAFLLARERLLLGAAHPDPAIRRLAFMCLGTVPEETGFQTIFEAYWGRLHEILDEEMTDLLCAVGVGPVEVQALLHLLREIRRGRGGRCTADPSQIDAVLGFLARYGGCHADTYRPIRREMTAWMLHEGADPLHTGAYRALHDMTARFRAELGVWAPEATDLDTGVPYGWDDVIRFEEDMDAGDVERIRMACERTPLIREAFELLFEGEAPASLDDIPRGGIWVTFGDVRHGRTHYRVAVRTRAGMRHDFKLTLYSSHLHETVETEILWNIRLAGGPRVAQLVYDIGGLYHQYALWCAALPQRETVRDLLARLLNAGDPQLRNIAVELWPFLAWSALAAYVEFWDRMDRRWIVAGPSAAKVSVPPHDYLAGTRIRTMTGRRRCGSLRALLATLDREFLESVRFHHSEVAGAADPDVLFLAVLEVMGAEEGMRELAQTAAEPRTSPEWRKRIERFAARIRDEGFMPRALVFAIRRYHRWQALAESPTPAARATMLRELWQAYGLGEATRRHGEIRVLFFRQTVFADAEPSLQLELDRINERQIDQGLHTQDLLGHISRLREQAAAGTEAEFFLARMAYPYLQESAPAALVKLQEGSLVHADLEVRFTDRSGRSLWIRHAATPREVGRLLRLFQQAQLSVHFLPEHRYLVVRDERGYIAGGLVYRHEDDRTVRIERYVVARHRRRHGIGRLLVDEFCNRMEGRGVETVVVVFMHPRYHQSLGFEVDHAHGGLVRRLQPARAPEEPDATSEAFRGEDRVAS